MYSGLNIAGSRGGNGYACCCQLADKTWCQTYPTNSRIAKSYSTLTKGHVGEFGQRGHAWHTLQPSAAHHGHAGIADRRKKTQVNKIGWMTDKLLICLSGLLKVAERIVHIISTLQIIQRWNIGGTCDWGNGSLNSSFSIHFFIGHCGNPLLAGTPITVSFVCRLVYVLQHDDHHLTA